MTRNIQHTIGTARGKTRGAGLRLLLGLILGGVLLAAPMSASGQTETQRTQDLIRSAMIYNFCKFVQWPADTLGDSIVLGVLGDQAQAPDFSSIVGKSVGDTPVTVRIVRSDDDLRQCQLVYITAGAHELVEPTLAVARAESILTISERDDFCQQGGIIQLVERRGKLRFFINRQAADRAQLSLSSQLLKVAKIVEGG